MFNLSRFIENFCCFTAQSEREGQRAFLDSRSSLRTSLPDTLSLKVGEESGECSENTINMKNTLEQDAQLLPVALHTPTHQSTISGGWGCPKGPSPSYTQETYSASNQDLTNVTANMSAPRPLQDARCRPGIQSSYTCRKIFCTVANKSQRCVTCLAESISDSLVKNQARNHAQNVNQELSDQKKAFPKNSFARSSRESSLLTEVLSWRRTIYSAFRFFTFYLVLIQPSVVYGSESPDRECCENPLYTFDTPDRVVATYSPPAMTYRPPEEPDIYPEVPDLPGN